MAQIAIGEAFEGAIITMNEYAEEVKNKVDEIFEELRQCCVVENQLEPLYKVAESLENMYNEHVLQQIKTSILSWAEGEGSYVRMTEIFRMGDDARNQAQNQQDTIVESINSMSEIMVIRDSRPDFSQTRFEKERIETKLQDISHQSKKLDEIAEEKNSELKRLGEENESIRTIISVGIIYGKSIANFVGTVTEKISGLLGQELDRMMSESKIAVDSAESEAEKFIQAMDEEIRNLDSIMAELFE